MADFRTDNGLTSRFYINTFNEIQSKSDEELWTEYIEHRDRPEPAAIATTAMYKYEMLRREAEKGENE